MSKPGAIITGVHLNGGGDKGYDDPSVSSLTGGDDFTSNGRRIIMIKLLQKERELKARIHAGLRELKEEKRAEDELRARINGLEYELAMRRANSDELKAKISDMTAARNTIVSGIFAHPETVWNKLGGQCNI